MPEAPAPYWADEPESTKNRFFGLSFKAYRALSYTERMALIAKHDKKRGAKPVECVDPVFGTRWTVLKSTKRKKK